MGSFRFAGPAAWNQFPAQLRHTTDGYPDLSVNFMAAKNPDTLK